MPKPTFPNPQAQLALVTRQPHRAHICHTLQALYTP